jgi:hypothetical protein
MPKTGRKVIFHGAFGSKAKARSKEQAGAGRYIRKTRIRGRTRFLVLSRRGR